MVRIMIKGGVWKNTEDEILKAAVMKYGKNQWSRVSSLLNRKSAKQCKARWYEWLDPSIKKVEWTREEEEKLLHLAKIYPSQWRTIAPIVGRTAAQCMEHYEHLLDVAQSSGGGDDSTGVGAEEARKLRPGEIDPHPETKPARPDPIDMDEDEKEMLAEARARLANTRGKKAKRKAREKQLEEAKRLANMQKRRELKAAGVEKKTGHRKRKYVDYKTEIPFQRLVPNGFFEVNEENDQTRLLSIEASGKDFEVQRLDQMEEKKRSKEEAEEKKKDRRKMKKMEESNPASIMEQISKSNDPMNYRARSELSLPAPQVSDMELESVLKIGAQAMIASDMDKTGNGSTSGLIGDYSNQANVLPTPMRTPRTASGSDVILQESLNQLAMMNTQTPLLGGENPNFELSTGTGFGGITPKSSVLTTPNVLGTPLVPSGSGAKGGGGGGGTPLVGGTPRGAMTPLSGGRGGGATPLRDELGVNVAVNDWVPVDSNDSDSDSNHQRTLKNMSESSCLKHQRLQLNSSLSNLPEPQYTYEVEVPKISDENDNEEEKIKSEGSSYQYEDAADIDLKNLAIAKAAEEAEFNRRNKSVKLNLPRPNLCEDGNAPKWVQKKQNEDKNKNKKEKENNVSDDNINDMIQNEMSLLVYHDAIKFPFTKTSLGGNENYEKQKKKDKKRSRKGMDILSSSSSKSSNKINLEEFNDELLLQSSQLIEKELNEDKNHEYATHHSLKSGGAFNEFWLEGQSNIAYLPERSEYSYLTSASANEKISALSYQFDIIRGHMAKHAEKCAKLERKLQVKTKGYEDKAISLRNATTSAFSVLDKRSIEVKCFDMLANNEAKAIPQRTGELYDLAKKEQERNAELQKDYLNLIQERDSLYHRLALHKSQVPVE